MISCGAWKADSTGADGGEAATGSTVGIGWRDFRDGPKGRGAEGVGDIGRPWPDRDRAWPFVSVEWACGESYEEFEGVVLWKRLRMDLR